MFDMISSIKQATKGDYINLKRLTRAEGYIVSPSVVVYFQSYDDSKQLVTVSLDTEGLKAFSITLRSIRQIIKPSGEVVYKSDSRDIVYGN